MASSWTKCNPEDPSTYPKSGERVDFVGLVNGKQALCRGAWRPEYACWVDITSDRDGDNIQFGDYEVTHWQPLPALPGEELAVDEDLAKVLDILEAGLADGSSVFGPMVSTALRVGARVEPPDAARKLLAAARRALAAKKEP